MSDSQIAQKVFFFVSGNLCPNGWLALISSGGFFFFDDKNIKRKFDPCNNPYDAWPIIVENHIAVAPYQYTIPQAWPTAFGASSKFTTEDRNPLRAAMIVFLKMNEDKL